MKHTLQHALEPASAPCSCAMRDITHCVICEKRLSPSRDQVDTCPGPCYQKLLKLQRNPP